MVIHLKFSYCMICFRLARPTYISHRQVCYSRCYAYVVASRYVMFTIGLIKVSCSLEFYRHIHYLLFETSNSC